VPGDSQSVEILSDALRKTDEVVKQKLYERSGVREHWVADPELETVKVYRSIEGNFKRLAELSAIPGSRQSLRI